MDRILIRDLRADTIIGVHERERSRPQPVVLGLELTADCSAAARSDELDDAVDYEAIATAVVAHVGECRFRLVERLAGSVADLVLEMFPRVSALTVTVEKPGAIPGATVAVELRRSR